MKKKNGKYREYSCISWYKDDELHREDGPALIWIGIFVDCDDMPYEYFLNGRRATEEQMILIKLNSLMKQN